MSAQTFTASGEGGKLTFADQKRLDAFIRENQGPLFVNIGRQKKIRSLAQNSYGYGVVLKELSAHTGNTVGQLKEAAKKELGLVELVPMPGGRMREVTRSSSTFTTAEWEQYMRLLRQWGDESGIFIQEPNGGNVDGGGWTC